MIRVEELAVGDHLFTPAARWEVVTEIDPTVDGTGWLIQLHTDRTGPWYAWLLPKHREVPALRGALARTVPTVRVESTRRGVTAFIGTDQYVNGWASYVLVDATPLGKGEGWAVQHRPSGGEVVRLTAPSKVEALVLVRHLARTHAAALGLRTHRPDGGK